MLHQQYEEQESPSEDEENVDHPGPLLKTAPTPLVRIYLPGSDRILKKIAPNQLDTNSYRKAEEKVTNIFQNILGKMHI